MQRLQYIDSIKGLAIFLMVMGHTLSCCLEGFDIEISHIVLDAPQNVRFAAGLGNFIYTFHMGLFFFISGYLTYKDKFDYKKLFASRTKRLLIPYIVLAMIYTKYWFLFSLWQITIVGVLLFSVLNMLKKGNVIFDALVIIVLFFALDRFFSLPCFNFEIIDVSYGMSFFVPFCFGMCLRKYPEIEDLIVKNKSFILIAFIILEIIAFTKWPLYWKGFSVATLSHLFLATTASCFIFAWFKTGINDYANRILSYIGKLTMQIYVIHFLFLAHFSWLGRYWLTVDFPTCLITQLLYSIVVAVFLIAVCIIVAKVINQSKLLDKLLFGNY